MKTIAINFRDDDKKPRYKKPKLIRSPKIKGKKLLLVDDVSKTGATLKKAKQALKGNHIKTFAIKGKADYSLYKFKGCIGWPW